MAFKQGHKKVGGRKKGTPNKKTLSLMEKCEEFGVDIFEEMLKALQEEVEPGKRFDMCKEIAQYIYPKRKAIEISGDAENPVSFAFYDYTGK